MNDIRRTILWVIFAFSLVMLWDQWQVHNGHKATFFPSASPVAAKPGAGASAVPPAAAASTPAAVPAGGAVANASGQPPVSEGAAVAHERITVSTDVLKLTFDTEGGSVIESELLKYPDDTQADRHVLLFDSQSNEVYQAQSGLIGGAFPNHKTPMAFGGDKALADGAQQLVVTFTSPVVGGVKLVRHGAEPGSKTPFYSTFTGPAFYTDAKKYQKVSFGDIEKGKAEFVKQASDGYVAMVQHYFASAWMFAPDTPHDNFARQIGPNLYAAGMIAPLAEIAPGAHQAVDTRLFVGPQVETMLESVTPGLELVKDYGWVTIAAKPLYWLLDQIHKVLGNWGWSIVALVLLLKIAFYWLNAKAYGSMAKMKALNPKITALRERLKDKPQQMQMEMMRIYREEKVNPLGGCLPILIQIPVFIALYSVLLASVEMRNAPWLGWITDLSVKDPLFILPVVLTLTTVVQTALNPLPPDPMQAKMMWIMPLVFSVMFFSFPAGLVLYWITNNTLTILQQAHINRRMGVPLKITLPTELFKKAK